MRMEEERRKRMDKGGGEGNDSRKRLPPI